MQLSLSQSQGVVRPLFALVAEAKAYISAVESALGASITGVQKKAINDFIKGELISGRWSAAHKRIFFPIWANSAANAIDMRSLTTGTFSASGVSHQPGYVQGDGVNANFNSGISPSGVGMTTESVFLGVLFVQAATQTTCSWIGSRNSATQVTVLTRSSTNSRFTATNSSNLISGAPAGFDGIFTGNRLNGTERINRRTQAGRSLIASATQAASGSIPTENVSYMEFNRLDGVNSNNDGQYGAAFFGLGMSDADDSAFTLALKTLWETCTGLSLP